MKKKNLLAILMIVLTIFTANCEQFGVLGQSGISGKDAKKKILDAANMNTFIAGALLGSAGLNVGSAVVFTILIDSVLVPSLAGVSDSKKYKVESVDDCVNKIKTTGLLILGNRIAAITCDLETSPSIIEIGPIEL